MSSAGKKILDEILELPQEEQFAIAATVLAQQEGSAQREVEEAWRIEVRRRIEEIRSGAVKTIPWEEVRKELWARANAKG